MAKAVYIGGTSKAVEHKVLEYIESTGTQYIDSELTVNKSDFYEMILEALFTNSAYGGANAYLQFTGDIASGSKKTIRITYDGSTHVENIYVDSVLKTTNDWTNSYSGSNVKIGIFKLGDANDVWFSNEAQTGRIYSCKIYKSNVLVRDFLPIITNNNQVGLWDKVNSKLHLNAGTGTFSMGSETGESITVSSSRDNVALKIKNIYIGVNGVARKVKKGYIGVNGVARLFYQVGIPLLELPHGALVKINENGSGVNFYLSKHDYESGLNGVGRTLFVRKDGCADQTWHSSAVNIYASCSLDNWFNSAYKATLDTDVQSAIDTTKFYYTPGGGNTTVTTLSRSVFALSVNELNKIGSSTMSNAEGSPLPIASLLQIAYRNGSAVAQWTRSPNIAGDGNNGGACRILATGILNGSLATHSAAPRPCFTLPSTALVNPEPNADGSYTLLV